MNIAVDRILGVFSPKDLRTFQRIVQSLKTNKRTVEAAMKYLQGIPEPTVIPTRSATVNRKHSEDWGEGHRKKIRVFRGIGRDDLRTTFKTMRILNAHGLEFNELESYIRRGN